MVNFWKQREKDLKKMNARRAQELAVKYFRPYCPVGRMAARIGMSLAISGLVRDYAILNTGGRI